MTAQPEPLAELISAYWRVAQADELRKERERRAAIDTTIVKPGEDTHGPCQPAR